MKKRKLSKRKKKERAEMLPLIQKLWESNNCENWELALMQARVFRISAKRLCRISAMREWAKDIDKWNERETFLVQNAPTKLGSSAIDLAAWQEKNIYFYMSRIFGGVLFSYALEFDFKFIEHNYNLTPHQRLLCNSLGSAGFPVRLMHTWIEVSADGGIKQEVSFLNGMIPCFSRQNKEGFDALSRRFILPPQAKGVNGLMAESFDFAIGQRQSKQK